MEGGWLWEEKGSFAHILEDFNENSNPLEGGSKNFINLGGVAENSSSNQIDNPLGGSNGSSNPFSNNINAPSDH